MCRLTKWLVFCLPLRRWKDAARRRHLARCPRCAGEDAALENAVRAFLTPAWTRENPGLEAKVRRQMDQGTGLRAVARVGAAGRGTFVGRRRLLQIAAGAALLFLSVGGWILFHHRDAGKALPAGSGPRVRVFSAELRGKPAKTYIYQTPKISIVLISPSKEIGGRP